MHRHDNNDNKRWNNSTSVKTTTQALTTTTQALTTITQALTQQHKCWQQQRCWQLLTILLQSGAIFFNLLVRIFFHNFPWQLALDCHTSVAACHDILISRQYGKPPLVRHDTRFWKTNISLKKCKGRQNAIHYHKFFFVLVALIGSNPDWAINKHRSYQHIWYIIHISH